MKFGCTGNTPFVGKVSDKIFTILSAEARPEEAIFRLYLRADDKDAFVLGLIGNLILRHRQWQGEANKRKPLG